MLYQMETLDYKARERAGVTIPMIGSPMPVFLSKDATIEVSFLVSSSVLPSCILIASQVKMSGILHSAIPFFCGPGELWLCQSEARC